MQKVAVGIKFICALEDEKIPRHMGEREAAQQQAKYAHDLFFADWVFEIFVHDTHKSLHEV